ncbi:MAG: hypothetical protein QM621_01240 [Aeromicrobium sp.]|uniref:hypothetical protein n=1 Tax=Aeromicrobium sp. TaxID=1871063 RepID=UPI0039E57FAB
MNVMDLDTWVSLVALLVALGGFTRHINKELEKIREEIKETRTELKGDIDTLRTESNARFDGIYQILIQQANDRAGHAAS